jgi:hypothetical protein
MFYIFFPSNIKVYILKKKFYYILISKGLNCFFLPISDNSQLSYSTNSRILLLNFFFLPVLKLNMFEFLNYYIYTWGNFIVLKIRFKHKGGWVYFLKKKWRLLVLNFGYSHRLALKNNNFYFKRFKKHFRFHLLVFCCYSRSLIVDFLHVIRNFFTLNIFTQRGIRLWRQKIYKKQGKVSKYMAFIKK